MILEYEELPHDEWIEYVPDRKGHDRRYSVDTTKITNLGWKKKHTLVDEIMFVISWYRSNRWWWEPLKNA